MRFDTKTQEKRLKYYNKMIIFTNRDGFYDRYIV